LKLAHDCPTGGIGLKDLPDPAPEGAAAVIDAIAAVIAGGALAQQVGWQSGA